MAAAVIAGAIAVGAAAASGTALLSWNDEPSGNIATAIGTNLSAATDIKVETGEAPESSTTSSATAEAGTAAFGDDPDSLSVTTSETTALEPADTQGEPATTVLQASSAPASAAETTTTTAATTTVAPTTAPTTTSPPTTAPAPNYEARGQAALASLSYQPSQIGWTISFHPGREGVMGYTLTGEHHIQIFVRDSTSDTLLRHVIAHEVGHAVDVSLNSAEDRTRWQEARGISDAPWWPGNGANDFSTGAGDFAESFAAWQVGGGNFRSNLGPVPNGDQLALMAQLASG